MDKQSKKQMLEQYKARKPDMGVIAMRCKPTGDLFLDISKDTPRAFNRYIVQLDTKTHANKALQALWNTYGADAFECTVYREYEYDDPTEDQTDMLELLLEECMAENPEAKRIGRPRKH